MAARDAGIDAIAAPEMSAKLVDAVVREFLHRGLTVNSSHGYNSDRQLHGLVMSFVSRDGRPLTLIAARGGQVSNDHYPYYEALFDDKMDLVQSHMFYFDVAGMEGAEGWPVLILSSIVAGILTVFAPLFHMSISVPLVRSLFMRRSARR